MAGLGWECGLGGSPPWGDAGGPLCLQVARGSFPRAPRAVCGVCGSHHPTPVLRVALGLG